MSISAGVFFLHEHIRNNYPMQYMQIASFVCYNCLYIYTKCEFYCVKIYKKIITKYPAILNCINSLTPKPQEYVFEFVKNGDVFLSVTQEQANNASFKFPSKDSYDFYIFSEYKKSKDKPIQKIIHTGPQNVIPCSRLSSTKFILSEITIGISSAIKKTIKISFANEKYTYFMDNNIINKEFMKFFMKKYHYNDIYNNDIHLLQNYTIKIIDDEVKIHNIDSTSYIAISENGYSIVSETENVKDKTENEYTEVTNK